MNHLLSRNALLGVLGSTAALSALIAVALVRGGDGSPASSPTPARSESSSAGLVAAKDPVTGELRAPTASEIAALQPAPVKGGAKRPVETVRLANGAVGITLDESTNLYNVASKGPDGTVRRACVPSDRLNAALEAGQNNNPTAKETANEK